MSILYEDPPGNSRICWNCLNTLDTENTGKFSSLNSLKNSKTNVINVGMNSVRPKLPENLRIYGARLSFPPWIQMLFVDANFSSVDYQPAEKKDTGGTSKNSR